MADAIQRLQSLADFFAVSARISYLPKRDTETRWIISLDQLYICLESGSTVKHPDGSTTRLLAAREVTALARSFEAAVEQLWKQTLESGKNFLLSSTSFGLFCESDDAIHKISPVENGVIQEAFVYEEERVRALLHKYEQP